MMPREWAPSFYISCVCNHAPTMLRIDADPGVYAPAEDTYLLLDAVRRLVRPGMDVMEVGTGTGIVAIECARRGARSVYANDISMQACMCARSNARRNAVSIEVFRGDILRGVRGEFDLLIFNPPYLPAGGGVEPDDPAWTGGEVGCETALRFLASAGDHLSPGGQGLLVFSSLGGEVEVRRSLDRMYDWEPLGECAFDPERIYVVLFG